jgi:sulfate transport system substrate-binding protein
MALLCGVCNGLLPFGRCIRYAPDEPVTFNDKGIKYMRKVNFLLSFGFGAWLLLLAACGSSAGENDSGVAAGTGGGAKAGRKLVLAAYTTPREVYGRAIIPAFQRHWQQQSGQTLQFQESYMGSGAQSRAVEGGFEADVVALSLEPDVLRLVNSGQISSSWNSDALGGMVSRSIVVIGVRRGNPLGVRDWQDLARSGIRVLTPNVKMSGGAMWNVMALYGAAIRGRIQGVPANDENAAIAFLASVLANVRIMDKGARESLLSFEKGLGDVIITYENEILLGRKAGKDYEYIVPAATVRIDNPAAVVDAHAAQHKALDVAAAFVAFLRTPEVQAMYVTEGGLRPVVSDLAPALTAHFPAVTDLFTVADLGGWPSVVPALFGTGGVYDKALAAARKK